MECLSTNGTSVIFDHKIIPEKPGVGAGNIVRVREDWHKTVSSGNFVIINSQNLWIPKMNCLRSSQFSWEPISHAQLPWHRGQYMVLWQFDMTCFAEIHWIPALFWVITEEGWIEGGNCEEGGIVGGEEEGEAVIRMYIIKK